MKLVGRPLPVEFNCYIVWGDFLVLIELLGVNCSGLYIANLVGHLLCITLLNWEIPVLIGLIVDFTRGY